MARVPYPDASTLSQETRATLGKLPPLNIFRMMAGGEGLLDAFTRMGGYLLSRSRLDPVLREIAIIRVGVLSRASYEVHQHETIGRDLGMGESLLRGIHAGPDDPVFTPLQRLVMKYTDDLVHNVRAGDATFVPLQAEMTVQELQELTVTVGFYMMVSRYLETYGVDIEPAGTPGVRVRGAAGDGG